MQSHTDYSIPITIFWKTGCTYMCKEVPVYGTTYSKLVTEDGLVLVLVSDGYGEGWSSECRDPSLRKQMILDSRLVQFVASEDFDKKSEQIFTDLCISVFSKDTFMSTYEISLSVSGFSQLCIEMIPNNSQFRINQYDGNESVEIYNPKNYITA
jgi:hypothetical protein